MKTFLIGILIVMTFQIHAQKGIINGTVVDDKTGETLVGVTVLVQGTTIGTATDFDGVFALELDTGNYNLQLSYISYQNLQVNNIQVQQGETHILKDLRLKESTLEIDEVVVSAELIRTTEAALNTLKKQSAVIMDGISASKMKLLGDNNAVDAAKRVTGVSIEDGKYVFVRGLGDRYSKTTLNGMEIPGLDPDRNTLQMDIFPASLIDNMLVSKNFSAEMPADFTGGIINIETKDFPESKHLNISLSTSYNPDMHFNPNYLTYKGGNSDFLGFDDGTRALPERAKQHNIPTPLSGASQQETTDFIKSFNPQLAPSRQLNPANYSLSFTAGNQFNLSKNAKRNPKLGYIFSMNYRTNYKYYSDISYGDYQRSIDPANYELKYATKQNGELGEQNVLIGILGGVAFKTNLTKIRLTGLRLQKGESRAGEFHIDNSGDAVGQSGYIATSSNLEYNQRSLTNLLLNGTHHTHNKKWQIDWRISPSFSMSTDPDLRRTAFTHISGRSSFMAGAGGNPVRIWRSLEEVNMATKFNVIRNFKIRQNNANIKFGASYTFKERNYEILLFDMQFFSGQLWPTPNPNIVLNPENIYPNKPNSIYYQSGNLDPNPNAYNATINHSGLYASIEFSPLEKTNMILGLRAESYIQHHTGRDQRYASGDVENGRNLENKEVLNSFNLFPSLNMIHAVTSAQNIRMSYSRTIARPSFKELSFAQILDPVSNRIFNGALFTYPGWDGKLLETAIDNIDLRWEYFLGRGQIISASIFYKDFKKPIELVRIPEQQTSTEYQPRNVGDGKLVGAEIEFNKNLSFVSTVLKKFSLNGNFTYVDSKITMTPLEYNARKTFQKKGEELNNKRQMAGQSPYLINAGITYSNSNAGLETGFFYNIQGPTLSIVGAGLYPDVFIKPYENLSFSLNKHIGPHNKTSIDLKISNLLDSKQLNYYKGYKSKEEIYSSLSPGRSISLGITYVF